MLSRPFFTIHEISELLKISEATVRSWIHQGELRAVRFGREFRVAAKDLEAFVEAHVLEPDVLKPDVLKPDVLKPGPLNKSGGD